MKMSFTKGYCLKLENCQVTANIETMRRDKTMYHGVQVAASDRPVKTTTRQMLGHFRKAQVPPKRIVKEFPVTPDAHIPVGESSGAAALEHNLRESQRNNPVCNSLRPWSIRGCGCQFVSTCQLRRNSIYATLVLGKVSKEA